MARLGTSLAVAAAVVLVLAGCLAGPEFTTPIEWGTSASDPSAVAIRLLDSESAELVNFPQGRSETGSGGVVCFEPSDGQYTGEATWEVVTTHRIAITYGESRVELSSDDAFFGSQDWRYPVFGLCGTNARRQFVVTCGDPLPRGDEEWAECRTADAP